MCQRLFARTRFVRGSNSWQHWNTANGLEKRFSLQTNYKYVCCVGALLCRGNLSHTLEISFVIYILFAPCAWARSVRAFRYLCPPPRDWIRRANPWHSTRVHSRTIYDKLGPRNANYRSMWQLNGTCFGTLLLTLEWHNSGQNVCIPMAGNGVPKVFGFQVHRNSILPVMEYQVRRQTLQ